MRGMELVLAEREAIEMGIRGKWGVRRIARKLHRDHSVVSREIGRNRERGGRYVARRAQEKADARARRHRRPKLEEDDVLRNWVVGRLQEGWSPEQVTGRLKNRPDPQVSGSHVCHETIYRYIYEGEGRFMGLYQYLPKAHKKRRRRFGRKHRKDKGIPFVTPIAYRPREIGDRKEFGHWESDSMVFAGHRAGLSVQRERLSHKAFVTKLSSLKAVETEEAIRSRIETSPAGVWKSLTFDRGVEGSTHWKLRLDYGLDTYHCDPYCSWQKGSVENTNGLIRRYFPRKADPDLINREHVYAVQETLNNRPRKSLQYKTPNEVWDDLAGQEVVH